MVYYQRNVYFPFIDHCVAQFNQRFPDTAKSLYLGYKLIPSNVQMLSKEDVGAIQTFYSSDLPDPSSFVGEVEKWEAKVKRDNLHVGKQSVLSTMAIADAEFFPNIHEIMKLILTIPVGSVPCERSFSAM